MLHNNSERSSRSGSTADSGAGAGSEDDTSDQVPQQTIELRTERITLSDTIKLGSLLDTIKLESLHDTVELPEVGDDTVSDDSVSDDASNHDAGRDDEGRYESSGREASVVAEALGSLEEAVAASDVAAEVAAECESTVPTRAHSRRDLLTGDWTIFAPQRDERPNEYRQSPPAASPDLSADLPDLSAVLPAAPMLAVGCPFCAGAEQATPEAIWSGKTVRDAVEGTTRQQIVAGEQADWEIRVVPNKFPAVTGPSEADSDKEAGPDKTGNGHNSGESAVSSNLPCFPMEDVVGGHEVFVESRSHVETITDIDPVNVALLLAAYRDRINHYRSSGSVKYISVFKNCGPDAGASLSHSHSQLIATSVLPSRVRSTVQRMQSHSATTGCCLQCDLIRGEIADGRRIIAQEDGLVAFCPFASRLPGSIRIAQAKHNPYFERQSESQLMSLAQLLVQLIATLGELYPGSAYNYLIHTFPPASRGDNAFHWSLELFPRLTKTAGFEWSSDCIINPMLPEVTAEQCRRILSARV